MRQSVPPPRSTADLANEIARLSTELANLLELQSVDPVAAGIHAKRVAIQQVRRTIEARRARDEIFDPGMFGDPAWEILLHLYLADLQGQGMPITKLCEAVPPMTTALRWISKLEEEGLMTRVAHPTDRRRFLLYLTELARSRMAEYFEHHSA